MLIPPILSIGNLNALIPIMVIIILIAAAAGASRGFSLFNMFGVASILGGMGSVGGATRGSAARSGFPLRLYLDKPKVGVGAGQFFRRRRGQGKTPTRTQKLVAEKGLRAAEYQAWRNKGKPSGLSPVIVGGRPSGGGGGRGGMAAGSGGWVRMTAGKTAATIGKIPISHLGANFENIRGAVGKKGGRLVEVKGRMTVKDVATGNFPVGLKKVPVGEKPAFFRVKVPNRLGPNGKMILEPAKRTVYKTKAQTMKDVVSNTGENLKFTLARAPVAGPLGVYGMSRLRPKQPSVEKPRIEVERDMLTNDINKDSAKIAFNNKTIAKIKTLNQPSDKQIALNTKLNSENNILKAQIKGRERRLDSVNEGISDLERANGQLAKGQITEKEHLEIFNQTYNKLYGKPSEQFHGISSLADTGAMLSSAGRKGAYIAASVPATTALAGEAIRSGFQKGSMPNINKPPEDREGIFKSYKMSEDAYLKVVENSYDPKQFSRDYAAKVKEQSAMKKASDEAVPKGGEEKGEKPKVVAEKSAREIDSERLKREAEVRKTEEEKERKKNEEELERKRKQARDEEQG